jgi:hypothetical protein
MSTRPNRPPDAAAPWLTVEVKLPFEDGKVVTSVVAPSISYAGGDQEGQRWGWVWQKLDQRERRTYIHLAKGLVRYLAETMPGLD